MKFLEYRDQYSHRKDASQKSQNASQFMSQSKHRGGNDTASEQLSLLTSQKKTATFLGGDGDNDIPKMSKKYIISDKKDGTGAKLKPLKTFQDSTQRSNAKSNFAAAPIEEVSRRKTVVFKQPPKSGTQDPDKENGLTSFSSRQADAVGSTEKLPCHGIGDGIGDIQGLDQGQGNEQAHSDPSPEVLEAGSQEGEATAFDVADPQVKTTELNLESVREGKAVTGILKKK